MRSNYLSGSTSGNCFSHHPPDHEPHRGSVTRTSHRLQGSARPRLGSLGLHDETALRFINGTWRWLPSPRSCVWSVTENDQIESHAGLHRRTMVGSSTSIHLCMSIWCGSCSHPRATRPHDHAGGLVKEMKRAATVWLIEQAGRNPVLSKFHWQSSYGVFSVSESKTDAVPTTSRTRRRITRRSPFKTNTAVSSKLTESNGMNGMCGTVICTAGDAAHGRNHPTPV